MGSGEACFTLGRLYHDGQVVDEDEDRALEFYTAATELGDPRPYPFMGRIYLQKAWAAAADLDVTALLAGSSGSGGKSGLARSNHNRCAELFVGAPAAGDTVAISDADYDEGIYYILQTGLIDGRSPEGLPEAVKSAMRQRADAILEIIDGEARALEENDPAFAASFRDRIEESVRWLTSVARNTSPPL